MKKMLALIPALALLLACAPEKPQQDTPEEPDTPKIEWRDSYNGHLVEGLAGAYRIWEEKGSLPTTIKWDGVSIFNMEYLRAGIALMLDIVDNPTGWADEDVEYPSANCSLNWPSVPFEPHYVPFADFLGVVRAQYANMVDNGKIDLRMKMADYEDEFYSGALIVTVCRAFAYFFENEKFPDEIDTWELSYTHSTTNCPIDDPVVVAARDAAFKAAGVTDESTDRQKAVALFNYARDKWEWENYNNTRYGAVQTITRKAGNCCDLSHAVCAMARLSGLSARYFHAQCHYSSGIIGHVISQIYVDGKWEFADASNNGNSFGTVSFNGYESLHYYESLPF